MQVRSRSFQLPQHCSLVVASVGIHVLWLFLVSGITAEMNCESVAIILYLLSLDDCTLLFITVPSVDGELRNV